MHLLHCTRIMRTVLYYYRYINFCFYTWVTCTTHSYHTFNILPAKCSLVLMEKITCYINYSTSKQPCLSCSKQAQTLTFSMGATVSDPDCTLSWSSFNTHQAFSYSREDLSHHVVKTVNYFCHLMPLPTDTFPQLEEPHSKNINSLQTHLIQSWNILGRKGHSKTI